MVELFRMVNDEFLFKKYKSGLDEINKAENSKEEVEAKSIIPDENEKGQNTNEGVILFFSFDVVNSSLYKNINYFGWSSVLSKLFEKIRKRVVKSINSAELWRLLGDEMIFIVRIQDKDNIFEYTKAIYKILTECATELKDGSIFDELELTPEEISLMKLQNILSIKGAAWIAIVNDKNKCGIYDNISVVYETKTKYKIIEFLGNDIDAGFRIAKQTCDRRLVISFELAYLLSKSTDNISNLFIISYKKLKGVWKERLYPIIWYYDKELCNNISFNESFYYDEMQECSLSKEYFSNRDENKENLLERYMFTDTVRAFNKILKDNNLNGKIEKIYDVIDNTSDMKSKFTDSYNLEFHCVAVCYDEERKKVLIAKRSNSKESNPSRWEFGCAKADRNEKIEKTIVDTYKQDFNVDIEIILDESRKDVQPMPIALYEISKTDGLHKGIITIAKLSSKYESATIKDKTKYSELKWINENEIDNFEDIDAIPDFKKTLRDVFNKMKSISVRS